MKLIQAHLASHGDDADLATEESEMVFTRRILRTVGYVSHSVLFHGYETLAPSGPFSWCPHALSDMPISAGEDFEGTPADGLVIRADGSISGTWHWRYPKPEDTDGGALVLHQPRSRALNEKQKSYRLEQGLSSTPVDSVPAILVETLAVATDEEGNYTIDCRYIATVEEASVDFFDDDGYEDYHYDTIFLGHPDAGG
ncbi:hypothetical protein F4803DRAFT_547392 [Xylaria telfairii]|nr:hypothetical protein F4803DRAFT_547392 [Xylaria telfairii]